jgi:hypothetical protein
MTGLDVLAGAAIVSAGTGIYEATQSSKISGTELGQSQTVFGEQQQYQNMLNQLITNPSSVSTLPGYQFELGQGSSNVARTIGAAGGAGGGGEAAALAQYGEGLASNFYGQQTSLLASLSGITAPSSPSQSASAATGASALTSSNMNNMLAQLGILAGISGGGLFSGAGTPASTAALAAQYGSTGLAPAGGGYIMNVPTGP